MSSRHSRRQVIDLGQTTKRTPFCKFCFDRKQSEEVYTSHFVKDQPGPNGKVVCPLLLAQQCANCGQHGHVTSRCSKSRSNRNDRRRRSKPSGNKLGAWIKPSDKKQHSRKRRARGRIQLVPSKIVVTNNFAPLAEKTTPISVQKSQIRFDVAQPALQGAWAAAPQEAEWTPEELLTLAGALTWDEQVRDYMDWCAAVHQIDTAWCPSGEEAYFHDLHFFEEDMEMDLKNLEVEQSQEWADILQVESLRNGGSTTTLRKAAERRVTFAHDVTPRNDVKSGSGFIHFGCNKPAPSEELYYDAEKPPSDISDSSSEEEAAEDAAYLSAKRSKNAWTPKSRRG